MSSRRGKMIISTAFTVSLSSSPFKCLFAHLSRLCLRCSLVSVVSAPTSLGRVQMILDVRSSRSKFVMPHRSIGMSLKRLQLRSRSVRLVRNVKFCGRFPRAFFDALRVSRSWPNVDGWGRTSSGDGGIWFSWCRSASLRLVSTRRAVISSRAARREQYEHLENLERAAA